MARRGRRHSQLLEILAVKGHEQVKLSDALLHKSACLMREVDGYHKFQRRRRQSPPEFRLEILPQLRRRVRVGGGLAQGPRPWCSLRRLQGIHAVRIGVPPSLMARASPR